MRKPIQDFVDHNPYFSGSELNAAYGVFGSAVDGQFFVYSEVIHYPTPPPSIPLVSLHPQVWADVPQLLAGEEGDVISLGPSRADVQEFLRRKTQRAIVANVKFDDALRDAYRNARILTFLQ
jgi:hypothetical protein